MSQFKATAAEIAELERKGLIPSGCPEGSVYFPCAAQANEVNVPMPPALNHMYPTGRDGKRHKSPKYREWLLASCALISMLGRQKIYPLRVRMTIEGKMRKGSDVDGRIKAILDCMVKVGVLAGDDWQHVSGVSINYKPEPNGYGIRIQLEKA